MSTIHLTDDDLVLHYYGEMNEAAEERTCAHLETCETCRANLAALTRVMAAIDSAPVPEPDAWFEQRTWARLESSLSESPRAARATGSVWALPWRAMAWGAAAALVVIAAFVAGQFSTNGTVPLQQAHGAQQPMQERVLIVDLGDHLDRTEAALVEFVSGTDGQALASGRERVEDLVAANRLYRRTAAAAGDQGVADVLDELERVLIEIANAAPTASTTDLDVVRQRIDSRGLLFKVRVMRERLQERVKDTKSVKGQDTTI